MRFVQILDYYESIGFINTDLTKEELIEVFIEVRLLMTTDKFVFDDEFHAAENIVARKYPDKIIEKLKCDSFDVRRDIPWVKRLKK